MTNLYEIAATFRADADKLADLDLDQQTLIDTIEGMSGDLETKAQNTLFVARNLEATADAIDAAATAMAARSKAIKARAAALRMNIFEAMKFTGIQKIEGPFFRLTIQNNPAALSVTDAELVPERFWFQPETVVPPREIDKATLKAALKLKELIPGAQLTTGQRLVVA